MSDPKYDVEKFCRDALAIIKSKLNTKISAINSEKADVAIDSIGTDAWFNSMIPANFTAPVFVIWGLTDQSPTDFEPEATLSKVTLSFEIGLADKNWADLECFYRLLRYQRALTEVVNENSQLFGNGRQPKIESLPPAALSIKGNAFQFSGINITIFQD